eukprot:gene30073-36321_t
MLLALFLVLCCTHIHAFTFLGKIKLPRFESIKEKIQQDQKFGDKKICVITGTSSGLGKYTAKELLKTGEWHVIGAVRDMDKMKTVAEEEGFDSKHFTAMECDLGSFASVRKFVKDLEVFKVGKPLDRLLDDMRAAVMPRVIYIGSVTGNDNTVGGGGVYPIADLKDLEGLKLGAKKPVEMIDGRRFNGAKAYKDSKLCLMMTANMLHLKYHKASGIAFSSLYPGCMAESPLFREKRPWFRKYFPVFMRHITGGFVSETEGGERVAQSGVYWGWNGGPREGRGVNAVASGGKITGAGGAGGGAESIFEVLDIEKNIQLFQLATEVTGAVWSQPKGAISPCPTLTVIKAVTALLEGREEARKQEILEKIRSSGRLSRPQGELVLAM